MRDYILYTLILTATLLFGNGPLHAQTPAGSATEIKSTSGIKPNLSTNIARTLRYRPEDGDFVIADGAESFNRSLYGGNTAFRIDGGDKPEFLLYLPGRGGNLRLGIQTSTTTLWLKDAQHITTRYRPGELLYEIRDPALGATGRITLEVLAYAVTEGILVRAVQRDAGAGLHLVWAFGGVNGQRGSRDGDIGTERVPISEYFQLQPGFAQDNTFTLGGDGFTLKSAHATIAGVMPPGTQLHLASATLWNDLPALLSAQPADPPAQPLVVGQAPFPAGTPLLLSLQRLSDRVPVQDQNLYRDVTSFATGGANAAQLPPVFSRNALPQLFTQTQEAFEALRNKVRIETPDPWLDAAMGALNVVADALWDSDAHAIMHGAIAWRTKLLGWRGPYALDDLGWHDRARENFNTWLPHQDTTPIPAAIPPPDPTANMARDEPGLHSNGDLSHSHYDMNMVFIDALFRHLLWTGDAAYARQVWPQIERHLAWERRLFRREYGAHQLPLYEAYASIWASDDLYYNGGGSAYASAYNVYANRMAARIAVLAGKDPKPYTTEADQIEQAMHTLLWMPDQGTFAEYKDLLGEQLVHDDYGLWNFYHTVDEEAVTRAEAWQMGTALLRTFRPIPVEGAGVPNDAPYHVFSETDWMPYSWSINNVVLDENMHTALALWQGGHAQEAYTLAKGGLLASMYMGISPGNVGTMDLYDVYRRESQRDFGDSAGTISRALVEGLFGIHPDALAGTLTLQPGFPDGWTHAHIHHPDLDFSFRRSGMVDTWNLGLPSTRFKKLTLRVPAVFSGVQSVRVNGTLVPWSADPQAFGRPMLVVSTAIGQNVQIQITWSGSPIDAQVIAENDSVGSFSWLKDAPRVTVKAPPRVAPVDWKTPRPGIRYETVDLSSHFNDTVTAIFKDGKYLSPRSPGVSLEQPWQGAGAWAGHLKTLPAIDDFGLRRTAAAHDGRITMPNGVAFLTPSAAGAKNIAFTSQWSNYPKEIAIPLSGTSAHAYVLMAGSTNFMQSRMTNGELVARYADGTTDQLELRNPETWWPIEQDYFIDDFQFPLEASLPPRINLRTGEIRLLELESFKGKGREVPGGAATVLDLPLDRSKQLVSLTLRTLTNDSVIGLMSVTLERP